MDLSQRSLQTNGKFLFNFKFSLELLTKNIYRDVNIDQSAMFLYQWIRLDKLYKLMEKRFQISELFFEPIQFFKKIVALGLCMRGGGGGVLGHLC